MYPTIVTMIYDIRKLENDTIEHNRKVNNYIELAKNFLLKSRIPFSSP